MYNGNSHDYPVPNQYSSSIGSVPGADGAYVVVGEGNAQVTLTTGHLSHLTTQIEHES
jgi:hypothetical protein